MIIWDRHDYSEAGRQTDGNTDWETYWQIDRKTDKYTAAARQAIDIYGS